MALERGIADPQSAPDAQAALMKIAALVKHVFEKAKLTQDVVTTGDFMLKAYGATTLLIQGKQSLAGLLPFLAG